MYTDLFSSMDGASSAWSFLPSLIVMASLASTPHLFGSFSLVGVASSALVSSRTTMCGTLLCFVLLSNFMGITPFVFPISSNLWVAGSLALPLWAYLLISSATWNPKKCLGGLLPVGVPAVLAPFIIVVESISVLIRPLTLLVRLVANVSAGHIIMALAASCLNTCTLNTSTTLLTMGMVFYNCFEVFVCFIQAYIFSLLISLYSAEHT